MAQMIATATRMTADEFSALEETNLIRELIDGEVIMTGAPLIEHQEIVGNTYYHLRDIKPDGKVYIAPLNVNFDEFNVFQPDVFWISEQNTRCVRTNGEFQGAPDLIVEVLSPSTAKNDRGRKFKIYQQYGVREYWLIDPEGEYVEVWQRLNDVFQRQGIYGTDESFASGVVGKEIAVQKL